MRPQIETHPSILDVRDIYIYIFPTILVYLFTICHLLKQVRETAQMWLFI